MLSRLSLLFASATLVMGQASAERDTLEAGFTNPRPQPSRITFTTWKHWNAEDPLLPSGLIGPVTLRSTRLVPVP